MDAQYAKLFTLYTVLPPHISKQQSTVYTGLALGLVQLFINILHLFFYCVPSQVGKRQSIYTGFALGLVQLFMFCTFAVAFYYGAWRVSTECE